MSFDQWLALALFAFVSSITPGPNNLMATASGARFGLRRTLPQVAGVTFGFTGLLLLAATGVSVMVLAHPAVAIVLETAGYLYLGWLAFKLLAAAWSTRPGSAKVAVLKPLSFWEASAFQLANPKAWMMALSTAGSFLAVPHRSFGALAGVGLLFALINFPCVGAWALMGSRLRSWLEDATAAWRMRAFNATMGGLLVATIAWMIASRG